EWMHEPCGEVVPDEHRPGHVDIRGGIAVQQVMDFVREVEVTRNDPDLERDPRLLLELGSMTLDARDVRVGVGSEEANDPHCMANLTSRSLSGTHRPTPDSSASPPR